MITKKRGGGFIVEKITRTKLTPCNKLTNNIHYDNIQVGIFARKRLRIKIINLFGTICMHPYGGSR